MKPRIIEIKIPGLPKTYNSIGRSHWTVKAKEARKWIGLVRQHINETSLKFIPIEKANLSFTRISSRLLDPDNVPQTFKHVMDGLVKAGLLVDDGPNNIVGLNYKQLKCKKGFEAVHIRIEEI